MSHRNGRNSRKASRVGTKISFISFISSTSEAAKPMTAGQFHSRAASVRFPQKWQK